MVGELRRRDELSIDDADVDALRNRQRRVIVCPEDDRILFVIVENPPVSADAVVVTVNRARRDDEATGTIAAVRLLNGRDKLLSQHGVWLSARFDSAQKVCAA